MLGKRKASERGEHDEKRVQSRISQTWSDDHQNHQDESGTTLEEPKIDQETNEGIIQEVEVHTTESGTTAQVQRKPGTTVIYSREEGSSASSSAQPESNLRKTASKIVALIYSAFQGRIHKGESANIYTQLNSYQRNEERRIILIGKTGTGKSTLGNAILGYKCFETDGFQMKSITQHCKIGEKKSTDGKNIIVLDTPGLKDTKCEPVEVIEELCKCTAMMAPGPHTFCLVIRGDERFTKENIDTVEEFCAFFGDDIYKYLIVVFTHKASMGESATINNCLSALPSEFRSKFLNEGGKAIAIESKAEKEEIEKQINQLFKLIEETIERNDGGYYSEEKFKVAEEAFRKLIPKIQQEVEQLFEGQKKSLEDDYEEKKNQLGERELMLKKKLQEEECKVEQEKQLKDKEKLEKDTCIAQMKTLEETHQKEIKSLEEKLEKVEKEKKKIKEEYKQKMGEINKKVEQKVLVTIVENRSSERQAVQESEGFGELARSILREGAGLAYNAATGCIENIGTVIRNIRRWFRG